MGICRTCQSEFVDNRPNKIFCNMDCYVANPERRARLIARNKSEAENKREKVICINCGEEHLMKISRKGKFCNRICYREYFAARFDRNIASSYQIEEFQNFDEFLTQSELQCPIKGCDWHGLSLGAHVNFAHGITAREFKKMCGFNLGSGLVSKEVSEALSNRPHLSGMPPPNFTNLLGKTRDSYVSKEAREHHKKSVAIRMKDITGTEKNCEACGVLFQTAPNILGGKTYKYCSKACSDEAQKQKQKTKTTKATCGCCGVEFIANYYQGIRIKKNKSVFCSTHCRQVNNSNREAFPHKSKCPP